MVNRSLKANGWNDLSLPHKKQRAGVFVSLGLSQS